MKSKDNKFIQVIRKLIWLFKKFWIKYWFYIILVILALASIAFTTWGLCEKCICEYKNNIEKASSIIPTSFFESIKLLALHHEFKVGSYIPWQLGVGRWLALITFLWLSGGAFIKFGFPTWLDKKKVKYGFKKHIVIFGKEEIYIELIRKIREDDNKTQIVLIVDKEVKKTDREKYTNSKLKIIEGNPLEKNKQNPEENILKIANIIEASKFFVVTDDDNKNVEIARNIWEYLKEHPNTKAKIEKKRETLKSAKRKFSESLNTLNEEEKNALKKFLELGNNVEKLSTEIKNALRIFLELGNKKNNENEKDLRKIVESLNKIDTEVLSEENKKAFKEFSESLNEIEADTLSHECEKVLGNFWNLLNKIDTEALNEENGNKQTLRCYTLVRDNDYKNILEETPIFKYKRKGYVELMVEVFYFDGVVFNLNSVGIQYGVNIEIENILPKQSAPRILIVGLNKAAVSIILNLSHILTKNKERITFHIIEKDKNAENQFNEKYSYLKEFAKFDFNITEKEILKNDYASIFVCNENNNEAVNNAVSIRYKLQKNEPAIFIVTSKSDYLYSVFNPENTESENDILMFKNYGIKIFNRLKYFWDLVIETRKDIENNAKRVHLGYKKTVEEMRKAEEEKPAIKKYEYLTETYKQSNRNAALDFYIKTYLQTGKTFDEIKKEDTKIAFTERDILYLAEIEHRRWMLEKLSDGWRYGEISKKDTTGKELLKDETFKIHECLITWEKLDSKQKLKDTIEYDKNQMNLLQLILNEKNENI